MIFVHPLRASHASPSLREGEGPPLVSVVLGRPWFACVGTACFVFLLGSRVHGNDGVFAGMAWRLRE